MKKLLTNPWTWAVAGLLAVFYFMEPEWRKGIREFDSKGKTVL